MNVLDAAYHTVRDYRGGASALAPRLGKAAGTLSHEVCPPEGSKAKLGLLDAMAIMSMTDDHRILHAMCAGLGGMFVPLPALEDGTPAACNIAEVAREFAEVMADVATGAADGEITDNEMARIERSWGELQRAGQQMLSHFARLNAAGKPRIALRAVGA